MAETRFHQGFPGDSLLPFAGDFLPPSQTG